MIPRLVTLPDGTVGLTFDEPSAPCPSYYVFPDDATALRAFELAIEAADRALIAATRKEPGR